MKTTDAIPTLSEGIAVIGMQGRFPGARNVQELWENLKNGVESITTFSEAELKAAGIDPSYINVPGFVNRGCVLSEIDQFDAGFFGYSARDAETMDPQQRVFMECAWESLEQAGCDPDSYPGMIGVFAGSDQSTYIYQIYSSVDLSAYGYGGMMSIANEKDYVPTQVSYKLNLRGPSMAIQTSCSTSLVAVCVACQNVLHGYCDLAVTGGVAISVPQKKGYWYQPGGIVSPDGHCRPFDAAAQGTVVGNGVGVVVLKRLSEAIADGDNIEAVIKGFALNNDGAAKVGYTAPSVDGQAAAIRRARTMAGVEPETIGYIEAHGTATALGDPVELAALTKAFRERTNKTRFCAIGSLKSNVGHLSSAAGICGLIKAILVTKYGEIPKSLHYEQPNPQIDWARTPFFVPSDLTEWPVNGCPRRSGVSSFGVGGTNAHVILEQAPEPDEKPGGRERQLLLLSARNSATLEKLTDNLLEHLKANAEEDLANVAFTLQAGRKAFAHRRALVFERSNREGLLQTLAARDPRSVFTSQTEQRDRPVIFLFSGQGTQYVGMGKELYQSEPTFREQVDRCCDLLRYEIGYDLRNVLYPLNPTEVEAERLKETSVTQPALFTIEYALAQLWMEWGVVPKAMAGHSIGEYVAACLAGVMELKDALSIVAMRGRLMESMPPGTMLAVPQPEAALQPFLGPSISLAAVNAPCISVLSGPVPAVAAVEERMTRQGLACRRLHTSHAFHSSMMDPILKQFATRLKPVPFKPPQIPYLSNLTGGWIRPELATSPDYWASHLRHTVRFADNLRELMVYPDMALLEIGPGHTLGTLARQQGSRVNSQLVLSSLRAAQEEPDGGLLLQQTVAKAWLGGVKIDWRGYHKREKRRIVALPTYPFERQRYWIGPIEESGTGTAAASTPAATSSGMAEPISQPAAQTAFASSAQPQNTSDWFYVPKWRPVSAAAAPLPNGAAEHRWLIFTSANRLGDELVEELKSAKLTIVERGSAACFDSERWRIRPDEKADYDALFNELRSKKELPTHVLHLWSLETDDETTPVMERFRAAQSRAFQSLIYLTQALGKSAPNATVQIGAVTCFLHSVLGNEKTRSAEAPILGACKVISQEYPNIRCRYIDVDPADAGLAAQLVGELTHESFDSSVAYRKGGRWLQEYESVQLQEPSDAPALLRDGMVCWVTGGLGNIGLVLAEAIARSVKAKFVLSGRSAFPEREKWSTLLQNNSPDPIAGTIRRLQVLEESGSELLLLPADVTNSEQVQAAIAKARAQWGRIDLVIHGAANLSTDSFCPVNATDAKKANQHFRTKDEGLLVLEEALVAHPPEAVVLLSSISAVLGGINLAAYAGSNAFLDARASEQNRKGESIYLSINWDAWDFTGANSAESIQPKAGGDAFLRILNGSCRQVVVSVTPLQARLRKWVKLESSAPAGVAASPAAAKTAGGSHPRPELSTQFVGARTATERQIVEVWESLLGVSPVGIHDKFFELGGHSLLAIQLLARLREIFELDLQVQRIFEAPTVAQLAEGIDLEKKAAPPPADTEKLDDILQLVEGLSEAELDALLADAEAAQDGKQSRV
jgi:acyl transferase domain-containing protein